MTDLNFEDIIIDIPDIDSDEYQWSTLINQIAEGNVVPVVGPDFLIEKTERGNIYKILIDSLAHKFGVKSNPTTFSQLVYDKNFLIANQNNMDSIYYIINQILLKNVFQPSSLLKRLLSIKQFPFVLTTTFTPIVENAMREVWQDRTVNVLTFSNNPDTTRRAGVGDIASKADMTKPTVYYMFGKCGSDPHRYVVTDLDMLAFCKSWLSDESRPKNLSAQLKDKYLLVLGSNYSDWLFRFIWYSMTMNKAINYKRQGMMINREMPEESLVEFLSRLDTFMPQNKTPQEIIDEIERRLSIYLTANESKRFDHPQKNTDVFISYSRSDSEAAEKLYQALTSKGLNVWYDKKRLEAGSVFMEEIEQAIRSAKIFVPIISRTIEKESKDFHVYRLEWDCAINQQRGMGAGRNFIIPVNEKNFDFYNADIPEGLRRHNSLEYDEKLDFEALCKVVMDKLSVLEKIAVEQ